MLPWRSHAFTPVSHCQVLLTTLLELSFPLITAAYSLHQARSLLLRSYPRCLPIFFFPRKNRRCRPSSSLLNISAIVIQERADQDGRQTQSIDLKNMVAASAPVIRRSVAVSVVIRPALLAPLAHSILLSLLFMPCTVISKESGNYC